HRGTALMRYLPLTDADRRAMLDVIGAQSVEELFRDVPEGARLKVPLDLPGAMGEIDIDRALRQLAEKNLSAAAVPSFLGAGAYRHNVPAAIGPGAEKGGNRGSREI